MPGNDLPESAEIVIIDRGDRRRFYRLPTGETDQTTGYRRIGNISLARTS